MGVTRMKTDDSCIFCKIIKGEIPCAKIYEDEKFLAFLDIRPLNKGHTLVIPKEHHVTMLDIPRDDAEKLMGKAQDIAKAISGALAPEGFNLFCNNGPIAGQEVPHLHVHIAPRFKNDGHSFRWKHGRYRQGQIEKVQELIKKFVE